MELESVVRVAGAGSGAGPGVGADGISAVSARDHFAAGTNHPGGSPDRISAAEL